MSAPQLFRYNVITATEQGGQVETVSVATYPTDCLLWCAGRLPGWSADIPGRGGREGGPAVPDSEPGGAAQQRGQDPDCDGPGRGGGDGGGG